MDDTLITQLVIDYIRRNYGLARHDEAIRVVSEHLARPLHNDEIQLICDVWEEN